MDKLQSIAGASGLDTIQGAKQEQQLARAKSLGSKENKSEEQIEEAASGFEALLLHQMLKAMWSTVQTTGLMGEDSNQAEMYRDMLNQAMADSISEGKGIGVKDFLKKELTKTAGAASEEVTQGIKIVE